MGDLMGTLSQMFSVHQVGKSNIDLSRDDRQTHLNAGIGSVRRRVPDLIDYEIRAPQATVR